MQTIIILWPDYPPTDKLVAYNITTEQLHNTSTNNHIFSPLRRILSLSCSSGSGRVPPLASDLALTRLLGFSLRERPAAHLPSKHLQCVRYIPLYLNPTLLGLLTLNIVHCTLYIVDSEQILEVFQYVFQISSF